MKTTSLIIAFSLAVLTFIFLTKKEQGSVQTPQKPVQTAFEKQFVNLSVKIASFVKANEGKTLSGGIHVNHNGPSIDREFRIEFPDTLLASMLSDTTFLRKMGQETLPTFNWSVKSKRAPLVDLIADTTLIDHMFLGVESGLENNNTRYFTLKLCICSPTGPSSKYCDCPIALMTSKPFFENKREWSQGDITGRFDKTIRYPTSDGGLVNIVHDIPLAKEIKAMAALNTIFEKLETQSKKRLSKTL